MEFLLAIYLFLFQARILCAGKLSPSEFTKKVNFLRDLGMNEYNHRREVYLRNLAIIKEHNEKFKKGLVSYTFKMNQFGSLTDEEFKNLYTRPYYVENQKSLKEDSEYYYAPKKFTVPATVDWREKGAVTSVKTQGTCANCYAFATVAAIETHYFIKNKVLIPFSEQQVMDCSDSHGLYGARCTGGGFDYKVYEYARDVGLTSQKLYPYESQDGPCRIKNHPMLVKLKGYKNVNISSVYDMEAAIALRGPASVAIYGTPLKFISGAEILTGNWCGKKFPTTHVVTVVGYSTTNEGLKYWIIKNTWGKRWGSDGYFYVERHKDDLCGIVQRAIFPELD